MSPTYTMRLGNRYRYYISQAYLRGGEAGSRPRISADEVERVVVEATCRQQSRDSQTTDFSTGVWSADIRELVRSTVERIVIHRDDLEIMLKVKELNGTIDNDNHSQDPKTIRLALPPARPRARKEILVPGNCGTQPRRIDRHSSSRSPARGCGWAACGRVNSSTRTRLRNALGSATPMSAGCCGLLIWLPTSWRQSSRAANLAR